MIYYHKLVMIMLVNITMANLIKIFLVQILKFNINVTLKQKIIMYYMEEHQLKIDYWN